MGWWKMTHLIWKMTRRAAQHIYRYIFSTFIYIHTIWHIDHNSWHCLTYLLLEYTDSMPRNVTTVGEEPSSSGSSDSKCTSATRPFRQVSTLLFLQCSPIYDLQNQSPCFCFCFLSSNSSYPVARTSRVGRVRLRSDVSSCMIHESLRPWRKSSARSQSVSSMLYINMQNTGGSRAKPDMNKQNYM